MGSGRIGGWGTTRINSAGLLPEDTGAVQTGLPTQGNQRSLTDRLLSQLVDRLAPNQNNYVISQNALAVGDTNVKQLSQISINGIIATVADGEIQLFFQADISASSIPDFVFNSSTGTVYIPLPAQMYQTLIIKAVGTGAATYSIRLIQY